LPRRALIETAAEHLFGDTVLEHFGGSAGDHPAARPPEAIFDD